MTTANNRLENVLILQVVVPWKHLVVEFSKHLQIRTYRLILWQDIHRWNNAAIIAGSKDEEHPEQALEQFWLKLSESFVDIEENYSSIEFSI
jgi:hypothetical protein